ncbi:MAG: hypothetical protein H6Q14_1233 [Bacteroidetes bacterium]|nr:hypothetical protein [Bacteroidota bacterium]
MKTGALTRFQFYKVRLKDGTPESLNNYALIFQFYKVRLKAFTWNTIHKCSTISILQSAIKSLRLLGLKAGDMIFQFYKVRLKVKNIFEQKGTG